MDSGPALYVVATPIGNLADMVPRAIEVLQSVDLIAAEDTRHSARLLQHFGIGTPMMPCHDHNEKVASLAIVQKLEQGVRVALISDAGTPLVSDPGYRLVDEALARNIPVIPVPGACAMVAALSVAGLPSDRFVFEGFLPAKAGARGSRLEGLRRESRTMIFYEAPHRVLDTLRDMVAIFGPLRQAVLARELTKLYETVRRLPLAELLAFVEADSNQQRGECVLLLGGCETDTTELAAETHATLELLLDELPLKQAVALAAKLTGVNKNQLYQLALARKEEK